MVEQRSVSPETLAAQALGEVDPLSGGLAPVINPATNYERQPDGSYRQGRVYSRVGNPTCEHAERLLAALEGGGCSCAVFASGMAAATAVFQSLLPGDHVLVSRSVYWGVRNWLAEFALTWGLDVEFTDTTDPAMMAAAIRPGCTRLLWVETPSNPTWELTDLATACQVAHAAGVRMAVDNTVATPVLTRPFEHGADLVVHSATKYLNGHSDVLAGAVLTVRQDRLWERIQSWRRNTGAILGPFEVWLLQRGMRTLFLRVRRASQTALAIATYFREHPALTAVLYPGLPSHPGHQIAARQMSGGFGGMLSIRLAGGPRHAAAVLSAVRVFKRATSFGGIESLIEHRAATEGPSSPVPGDLIRLSIGIESADDLITDLDAALGTAYPRSTRCIVDGPGSGLPQPRSSSAPGLVGLAAAAPIAGPPVQASQPAQLTASAVMATSDAAGNTGRRPAVPAPAPAAPKVGLLAMTEEAARGQVGVRPAKPGDAPFITGLARCLAAVSRLPWLPPKVTDLFAASGCQQAVAAIGQPDHVVLLATGGRGEPLGFVHAYLDESVFTGEQVGYVSTIVVTAQAAGSGVGRGLMAAAEEWARRQGCTLMTLEVFGQNRTARAVYLRLGYQEQTLKLAKRL